MISVRPAHEAGNARNFIGTDGEIHVLEELLMGQPLHPEDFNADLDIKCCNAEHLCNNLSGGRGEITGTIAAVLIIAALNNGMNILKASSYYQDVIKAVVTLVAVLSVSAQNTPFFVTLVEGAEAQTEEMGVRMSVAV